ncbi:hypothetical protein L505_1556 [Bordetella bronchiseptica F4563]|nr:hypothetical protein L507_1469 [Bordetella bronchiseptica CA90 BB02]KDC30045.1 hypothetical protein L505_1556 [Bordetella bronchiseptica F4563]KDC60655.1 hypothetical protein L510_1529 [Bordetella bronchiseptica MBORD591]
MEQGRFLVRIAGNLKPDLREPVPEGGLAPADFRGACPEGGLAPADFRGACPDTRCLSPRGQAPRRLSPRSGRSAVPAASVPGGSGGSPAAPA